MSRSRCAWVVLSLLVAVSAAPALCQTAAEGGSDAREVRALLVSRRAELISRIRYLSDTRSGADPMVIELKQELAGVNAQLAASSGKGHRDIGTKPPRGAVVLFSGRDTSAWVHRGSSDPIRWKIVDGALEVTPGAPDIVTKQEFGDYLLHVEFWLPLMADKHSQERANSGVYNHGRYEIQVLDSLDNPTYKAGGCASLYGVKDPDVLVPRKPMEWQSYDITFRAPRMGPDGQVTEKPRLVTVFWNGVKVHDNVEVPLASTVAGIGGAVPATGPILLQNHGNPVRYKNVWIKPLKLK